MVRVTVLPERAICIVRVPLGPVVVTVFLSALVVVT
jgi:hypothetical protein